MAHLAFQLPLNLAMVEKAMCNVKIILDWVCSSNTVLASSTHEAPSLRESGEQDQHQENEPHVHTTADDTHGQCR